MGLLSNFAASACSGCRLPLSTWNHWTWRCHGRVKWNGLDHASNWVWQWETCPMLANRWWASSLTFSRWLTNRGFNDDLHTARSHTYWALDFIDTSCWLFAAIVEDHCWAIRASINHGSSWFQMCIIWVKYKISWSILETADQQSLSLVANAQR